ncbi:MAG: retroviral-like aspartic protease [Cyanobacteria bacterium P01_G01_bin.54]
MLNSQRFPFVEKINDIGVPSSMPYLPIILTYQERSIESMALLDTGASVNVLPSGIGLELGAVWDEQTVPLQLGGNLARTEAKGMVLSATIAEFSPVLLAFAWTQSREAPLLLGQMNFFAAFDACFYRANLTFELCPRMK